MDSLLWPWRRVRVPLPWGSDAHTGGLLPSPRVCQPSLIPPKRWPPRGLHSLGTTQCCQKDHLSWREGSFSSNHQVGHESWGPGWGADTPNGLFLPLLTSVTLPVRRHCPSTLSFPHFVRHNCTHFMRAQLGALTTLPFLPS